MPVGGVIKRGLENHGDFRGKGELKSQGCTQGIVLTNAIAITTRAYRGLLGVINEVGVFGVQGLGAKHHRQVADKGHASGHPGVVRGHTKVVNTLVARRNN